MLLFAPLAFGEEPVARDAHGCWPGQSWETRCEGTPTACPAGFEPVDRRCAHTLDGGVTVHADHRLDAPPPCVEPAIEYGGACYPVLGTLPRRAIHRVIRRRMGDLRECYDRQLLVNPELGGKVTVRFVIAPDGSVQEAGIKASTMGSEPVETCVTDAFRTYRFPEPKGGIVIVSYPFIFSPG